jgi:hypothetical protein
MLTGYGTVRPPDVSGTAGNALVTILDEVAPVYPATREWFLNSYGLNRSLTPYDLARIVLESAEPRAALPADSAYSFAAHGPARVQAAFAEVEKAREAGFAAIDGWVCKSPGAPYHRQLEAARRRLVVEAAASRARGVATRFAREMAGAAGARWTTFQLLGARWQGTQIDSATVEALRPIAEGARAAAKADFAKESTGIGLAAPPERCTVTSLLAR